MLIELSFIGLLEPTYVQLFSQCYLSWFGIVHNGILICFHFLIVDFPPDSSLSSSSEAMFGMLAFRGEFHPPKAFGAK